MGGLAALTTEQLALWTEQARHKAQYGQVMTRISRLKAVQADWFATCVDHNGQADLWGDIHCVFPLMSVIKPFMVLYLLEQFGADTLFRWVGMQPSDAPFNSLEQLIADSGRPRNPMLNSGAIALAGRLPGATSYDRCQGLCAWLNHQARCHLEIDKGTLVSVRSEGRGVNQAIAETLVQYGHLAAAEIALDTYEQICCLAGQVSDLARLGNLLAHPSAAIASQHRRAVNALMLTCGLYEASSTYAVRIGLPMKSGISGALLSVVPGQGSIACYSPALDPIGNPIAGLALVEVLAQRLELSVF
ncbi:MAG: glutaminase [Oscillatoriophycideae cyanobacterium NC_groundwater_1537_Pr4_S-0.65um_50_18]|nr:glutaminase [Oscillatoriophycideae cyanobacterium NC_groundwater_1537_Pr4_S-0.65um_50_18]